MRVSQFTEQSHLRIKGRRGGRMTHVNQRGRQTDTFILQREMCLFLICLDHFLPFIAANAPTTEYLHFSHIHTSCGNITSATLCNRTRIVNAAQQRNTSAPLQTSLKMFSHVSPKKLLLWLQHCKEKQEMAMTSSCLQMKKRIQSKCNSSFIYIIFIDKQALLPDDIRYVLKLDFHQAVVILLSVIIPFNQVAYTQCNDGQTTHLSTSERSLLI